MQSFWTPLRVGLVVAAAAVAFALGLYFIGANIGRDKSYRVFAMFDDATGLGARSRVQIAGIPVGQVDHIELDQATARARVWLKIKQEYPLHRNASITKRSESILGDFLLDLTPGTPDQPLLKDGDEIRNVVRQPGMNEVFNQLSKIAGDIGAVTANLRKTLGGEEGENNLRTIVENLTRITEGIEGIIDRSQSRVDAILGNVQSFTGNLRNIGAGGEQDVLAILQNTRAATAEARDILKTIGNVVGSQDTGELKKSVGSVRSSMEKLDTSLANIREITDKINKGEGTIGRLVNDDRLAKNLEKTTSSLNDVFAGLGQLKIELQERNEFLLGCTGITACDARNAPITGNALVDYSYNPWTKNYFSIRIIPKPDKWYGFELVDDPRGSVRRVQVRNTLIDPAGPNQFFPSSYTQITTERQLKFSAYIAKRYGPISGRFGILENTGGFGVKMHLLNDSLIVSADAFEFANPLKQHPRIKVYADYRFLDHLFITVGADDLVNGREFDTEHPTRIVNGRDYFFGAGFYFTDDDVKLLLSALPFRF
ncbi:MAG: MCE family protein [Deltaproteobacteria bacterium]|nr:MAG: MCE family protein [Deltaproteobacteria bacterium]